MRQSARQNKFVFLLFAVLMSVLCKAQTADTAFAAVRYTFLYVTDTTRPNEVTSENMILYLGKNSSAYKNYDKVLRDSAFKSRFERMKLGGGGKSFTVTSFGADPVTALHKDFPGMKLMRIENLVQNYLIEEPMPSINWVITQEVRIIGEIPCQKATAGFRGRNYTAWFCSQLPYSNGPWKLGGLPGLIIEASDEENQVVFHFAGFEDVKSRGIPVSVPKDVIQTNEKEYMKLKATAEKDPDGFNNSNAAGMQGGGLAAKMSNLLKSGNRADSKKTINNNPIERVH